MNLDSYLEKINIKLSQKQKESFDIFADFLVEYNENVNLTAITEKQEIYIKHFYDSLVLSYYVDLSNKTLCDVGGGAGFPSVPNAIYNKDVKIDIIDGLNKRIIFLDKLKEKLQIDNFCAIHQRAEEHQKQARESYDVVTARAVARLYILAELCMPLVKVGGYFVALKSTRLSDELLEAKNAIKILGGEIVKIEEYELPENFGKREILIVRKIKNTPDKYPRVYGQIKKNAL